MARSTLLAHSVAAPRALADEQAPYMYGHGFTGSKDQGGGSMCPGKEQHARVVDGASWPRTERKTLILR